MEPDELRELPATAGETGRDPEERRWTKTSGHTHSSRPDWPDSSKRSAGAIAGIDFSQGQLWLPAGEVGNTGAVGRPGAMLEAELVVDVDIKGYFDNIPHDLLMKAVRRHCQVKWMLLYIERWLKAPLQKSDGTLVERTKGVPQGSVIGPVLANLYLHYGMDKWLEREYPQCRFERYADDAIIHCRSMSEAVKLKAAISDRLKGCGLELHPEKTQIVYCKDSNRRQRGTEKMSFDFASYTFKPRLARNSQRGEWFTNWLPAVSNKAMRSMNGKMREWEALKRTTNTLLEVAAEINPVLRGWINYYGKFYKAKLVNFMHIVNVKLASWARRKYKNLRASEMKAIRWLYRISVREPTLFAHWALLGSKPTI